jgi:hypothetical protein
MKMTEEEKGSLLPDVRLQVFTVMKIKDVIFWVSCYSTISLHGVITQKTVTCTLLPDSHNV